MTTMKMKMRRKTATECFVLASLANEVRGSNTTFFQTLFASVQIATLFW
jgi:hypothetical protein